MGTIISESNQWIKKLRLLQKRKYREDTGQFVIEGLRFCQEAVSNNANIEAVLVSEDLKGSRFIDLLWEKYPTKVLVVKDTLLQKSLMTITPQGIAAIVHRPTWDKTNILNEGIIVIVDGVQDPGNLGTILRTALGAGVKGVFCLKGTVDLFNDKTLRSTMGAIFNLPVFVEDDAQKLTKELKANNYSLIMADPQGEHFYYNYTYEDKVALILGSEGRGPINITKADVKLKIPLNPQVESLNVAVSNGIILYEIVRQRNKLIEHKNL